MVRINGIRKLDLDGQFTSLSEHGTLESTGVWPHLVVRIIRIKRNLDALSQALQPFFLIHSPSRFTPGSSAARHGREGEVGRKEEICSNQKQLKKSHTTTSNKLKYCHKGQINGRWKPFELDKIGWNCSYVKNKIDIVRDCSSKPNSCNPDPCPLPDPVSPDSYRR